VIFIHKIKTKKNQKKKQKRIELNIMFSNICHLYTNNIPHWYCQFARLPSTINDKYCLIQIGYCRTYVILYAVKILFETTSLNLSYLSLCL
jgi:hypothetical protein